MDTKQKYSAALLAVLALGIAWLKWTGHPSVASGAATNAAAGVDPFTAPYGWSTPGISDDPNTLNGGPPFQSSVNVNVNPSYLASLSQQYIPLFGFVGLAVGTGNDTSSNVNTTLSAPPQQAANFVSPNTIPSPNPFAGTNPFSPTNMVTNG
jgi:hypothetical protein